MFKKILRCLTLVSCITFMHPVVTNASEPWIISRSHAAIEVTKDGEVVVEESINADFGDGVKTGLIRQIPLKYSFNDQVWFVEVSDIKVQRTQVDEPFTVAKNTDHITVNIGDPRLELSGLQDYTISYKVKGALRSEGKTDGLFLFTAGGWGATIEQATAIVTLPKEGISNQSCHILTWQGEKKDECQSVGLKKTESRYVAKDVLNVNSAMAVQASFAKDLVPIESVRPPSIADWVEVYRQPLIILVSISGISLIAAGALWYKARRVQRIAQENSKHA